MVLCMSWNVEELNDNTLRLLCVDGLGGATLTVIDQQAGGLLEAGNAIISGDAGAWLPDGACELLRERMRRVDVDAARLSAIASNSNIVAVTDDDFPRLLRPLPACPALLWYRGNLQIADSASVAIVGARKCTSYGKEQAGKFARRIALSAMVVTSGGARGIDAAAHRTALLHGGRTCVVLGSGLHDVYPKEHVALFEQIVLEGGIVFSEFPCYCSPKPANFPRRNRIVSGLASVVLVVEAAKRSGALITARIAVEEHGREAFVIPGRIEDASSAGCLQAIADGWVGIAIEPELIVEEATSSWNRLINICA